MVERKKSLFTIDHEALTPEAIAKEKVKASTKRSKKLTIEQLLAAAKDLGVQVYIPSTSEQKEAQESSIEKLGFVLESKVSVKESNSLAITELTGHLNTRHNVSGVIYGPGDFTVSYLEKDLYNSLLKQDQMSTEALRDTVDFGNSNKSFIIERGIGRDKFSKFIKREVSAEYFAQALNSSHGTDTPKVESAGYRQIQHRF